MSNYENAMKILDELCGNDKEELIALATVASSPNAEGNPRPAVRMICAYYENGVFYASTNAKSKKMLQIEKNNQRSVCIWRTDLFFYCYNFPVYTYISLY
mgnify:CR=1 FL=1